MLAEEKEFTPLRPLSSILEVQKAVHYNQGQVECIDALEAAIGNIPNGNHAFLTGQVIKYMWRWYFKHDEAAKRLQDLEKARWYLDRLIADMRAKFVA